MLENCCDCCYSAEAGAVAVAGAADVFAILGHVVSCHVVSALDTH